MPIRVEWLQREAPRRRLLDKAGTFRAVLARGNRVAIGGSPARRRRLRRAGANFDSAAQIKGALG
jgi:hypothetical protein